MDDSEDTVTADEAPAYCVSCGKSLAEGDHTACRHALRFDPPRYCEFCGRRMKVQVSPTTWTATCSRHPELEVRTSAPPPA